LVVNISSMSVDSLNYCVNSGLISEMIGELTGNDVLVRATCIEMVTSLAHTQHGRQYLAQQGIIDKISNIIIGADSDPFSGFYLPGDYRWPSGILILVGLTLCLCGLLFSTPAVQLMYVETPKGLLRLAPNLLSLMLSFSIPV
ncbi:hypothetical protein E2320_006441, partial [Naja naja]